MFNPFECFKFSADVRDSNLRCPIHSDLEMKIFVDRNILFQVFWISILGLGMNPIGILHRGMG